jgi:hypothetical protein
MALKNLDGESLNILGEASAMREEGDTEDQIAREFTQLSNHELYVGARERFSTAYSELLQASLLLQKKKPVAGPEA